MHVSGALDLANRGWAVLPVRPRDKIPASAHGSRDATTDHATIRDWWRQYRNANAGIATGPISGLWVLDIDGDAGRESLASLEREHGALPRTLSVQTARGRHLYWKHPDGPPIRNAAALRPGLDVRGDGGYVVAPGSLHPSGVTYEWEADAQLEAAPAWLLDLVTRPEPAHAVTPRPAVVEGIGGELKDPLARRALREGVERMRRAHGPNPASGAGGNRNETLNREAHAMGATGVPRHLAESALISAALSAGLSEAEARASFVSGYEAGLRMPRARKSPRRGYVRDTRVVGLPDRRAAEDVDERPIAPAPSVDDSEAWGPADAWESSRREDAEGAHRERDDPPPQDSRAEPALSVRIAARRAPPDPEWRDLLLCKSKSDELLSTAPNAMLFALHEESVRSVLAYDLHAHRAVVLDRPPWLTAAVAQSAAYPRPLENYDISGFRLWLQTSEQLVTSAADAVTALEHSARECSYNPVTDYLDGLTWDGVPRIADWLNVAFDIQAPLSRVFGARWLIAAVARAYKPGEKVDSVLVLEGPQGLGKSTALRILGGEFFSDAHIDLSNKDGDLNIQGVWIQELSELAGVGKAELNRLKGWITRQDDKFRAPYLPLPSKYPRVAVFAATTNERHYLSDPTGNRRWWPNLCVGKLKADALRAIRDQLWAEAVVSYRAGKPWHLDTPELVRAQEELVGQRVERDPWEELLTEWLDGRGSITTHDCFVRLNITADRRTRADQMRIGRILFRLGFTEKRLVRSGAGRPNTYFRELPLAPEGDE